MQVSDVDLRLLRVFLAVVRAGGFTPAQAILNVSQSTLSNHMADLEQRLGLRLCERGRRGFRLTEQGRAVHQAAERLMISLEDFRSDATALRGELTGELRLGLVDGTVGDPASPLSDALARFAQLGRRVTPVLIVADPPGLEQAVASGRLDAAIGFFTGPIATLVRRPLYKEEQVLCCGAGHALFDAAQPSIDEVKRHRLVGRSFQHMSDLGRLGVAHADAVANSIEATLILILTGQYLGYLPAHVARPWINSGLIRVLLENLPYVADMVLITQRGNSRSMLLNAFLRCIEQVSAELPKQAPLAAGFDIASGPP